MHVDMIASPPKYSDNIYYNKLHRDEAVYTAYRSRVKTLCCWHEIRIFWTFQLKVYRTRQNDAISNRATLCFIFNLVGYWYSANEHIHETYLINFCEWIVVVVCLFCFFFPVFWLWFTQVIFNISILLRFSWIDYWFCNAWPSHNRHLIICCRCC